MLNFEVETFLEDLNKQPFALVFIIHMDHIASFYLCT